MSRNYTLLIDKSGSMSSRYMNTTRWLAAKDAAMQFGEICLQRDPDGIDVIFNVHFLVVTSSHFDTQGFMLCRNNTCLGKFLYS